MRGNELLDRMDLIDPQYVEAADAVPARKRLPMGWIATAACFCLLLAGVWMGIHPASVPVSTEPIDQTIPPTVTVPVTIIGPIITDIDIIWDPQYNEYSDSGIVADGKRVAIPGYFIEELTKEEIQSIMPRVRMLWMELSGHTGFDGEGKLIDLFLILTTPDPDADITLMISRYAPCDRAIVLDQEPVVSLCGSVEYTLYQLDSRDGRTYFNADAEQDGWYWRFSMDVPTEKADACKQYFQDILACYSHTLDAGQDFSGITPEFIPEYFDYQLSHTEAIDDPAFGAYFLRKNPEGYSVETIRRYKDYRSNYLSGMWCRGYDELYWHVSRITEEDRARVTSVTDTENYDLSLYPIPRADSVPEELREIVDNPIFLAEELTLETVMSRAYQVNDAGDTDGWRMQFSVLYGDTLVEVRTKGVDPEWLFDQLISLLNP